MNVLVLTDGPFTRAHLRCSGTPAAVRVWVGTNRYAGSVDSDEWAVYRRVWERPDENLYEHVGEDYRDMPRKLGNQVEFIWDA